MNKSSKFIMIIKSLLTSVLIISASIALPILFKPFYYLHLNMMKLNTKVGLSTFQVKQAYNEVINYCIGLEPEFSAGVFKFSESAASHFADVRSLFIFDLFCVVLSALALLIIYLVSRSKDIKEYRFKNKGSLFYGPSITLFSFMLVGLSASLNFNKAFTIFHKIFFIGKKNWVFSYKTDPIIYVLPQSFFMNCAILIVVSIIVACVICIYLDQKSSKIFDSFVE